MIHNMLNALNRNKKKVRKRLIETKLHPLETLSCLFTKTLHVTSHPIIFIYLQKEKLSKLSFIMFIRLKLEMPNGHFSANNFTCKGLVHTITCGKSLTS